MAGVRGKDKSQRKKRSGLTDKQREDFKKKLKATANAKASKKRKQNQANSHAAKHSLIGKMLGSTANSGSAKEGSIVNEGKLKSPEDEHNADDLPEEADDNTDAASLDNDDDGNNMECDNMACLFEEESPTEKENVSIQKAKDLYLLQ